MREEVRNDGLGRKGQRWVVEDGGGDAGPERWKWAYGKLWRNYLAHAHSQCCPLSVLPAFKTLVMAALASIFGVTGAGHEQEDGDQSRCMLEPSPRVLKIDFSEPITKAPTPRVSLWWGRAGA